VDNRETHFSTFNLEQHIVSVNPSSYCSYLYAMENVFLGNFGLQSLRQSPSAILKFL
jgi:hypothetical protein